MSISKLYPIESAWSVSQGDNGGLPLIIRCNSSAEVLIGRPEFSLRVGIAIPFNEPTENGLPTLEESNQLSDIEDLLTSHLEANQTAILVIVVTTDNMREFVFYGNDEQAIDTALAKVCDEIAFHEVQSYIESDPEWALYQEFAG